MCQFLIGNVQQQYLSAIFLIILPIFPKINHFSPQKSVDLKFTKIAIFRMITGFAGIFPFPPKVDCKSN